MKVDLTIIGAGPGGYEAAVKAAHSGLTEARVLMLAVFRPKPSATAQKFWKKLVKRKRVASALIHSTSTSKRP